MSKKKAKKKVSEYAQNLSHELLTPLTVIRSKVENLMQSTNMNGEDLKNLDVILKNVRRITHLNKSLILLSKIDEEVYVDRKEVNLKSMTEEILENFEDQIRGKALSIRFTSEGVNLIDSNTTLVDILITNLIKNSIVHNQIKGHIRINLTDKQLQIANSFDKNYPPPAQHFKRFTTSKSEEGSLGLGLSIVKRICKYLTIDLVTNISETEYSSTVQFN